MTATDPGATRVRRALISVSDKAGLVDLARRLVNAGVEIVSSGATAAALAQAGVAVTKVSEVTGSPEILGGRVKTLHPKIHGAILAAREREEHVRELAEHGIEPIDLVVCNLYPFEQSVVAGGLSGDEALEQIDVGGPAMVRAAAKNWRWVAVVTTPKRYDDIVEEIRATGGVSWSTRRELAVEAFRHTASYDAAISSYLSDGEEFPDRLVIGGEKLLDLRYGENPHQKAAFYRRADAPGGLGAAEQLHGKALSYNNLLDSDAAWRLACELQPPGAVIVKHGNPCGVGVATSTLDAYVKALECDRTSAFGGVVALNRSCDRPVAEAILQIFTEVLIAPSFDAGALEALRAKKNIRLLRLGGRLVAHEEVRSVAGGLLLQSVDPPDDLDDAKVVTRAQPSSEQRADLAFAWTVTKHVKSNAIVFARSGAAVGIGAGQMSRVEATELAAKRARGRAEGAACASDGFFPFRDGLDAAVAAGATSVIQPGGSVRDDEVVAAADEHGIPMLFTGRRHFRH